MPSTGVRMVGVYFSANGKFYAVGGRSMDGVGNDFTHPFEYDPISNTWTIKSATFPDNQVSNMACGVLTVSGTPFIYCVGGSAAGKIAATARVFFYNPAADTVTTLTGADNWPGDTAGTILPGGSTVANNKLYILGGFNINVASTNQIWEFDPTAAVGSKWTQKVNTPEGVMYAPTCTIDGFIYLAGASDYQGGTVVDTTNSFTFDPVTNTIGSIPPIPRATGETRALNFNGQMYVMGGGRVAPNPSNEVDICCWTTGDPFVTARRNFPTDTNGTDHIWLAGGYDVAGVPIASMEIFCSTAPSPTPTPTATPTATPTPTCIPGGTPGPWTEAAVYPAAVYGAAVASDGANIYAFGGNTAGGAQHAEAYRYDPLANTWTALASMTTGPDYLFHAEYGSNGKIYVMGGQNDGTLNRIYDIATNTWSAGAPVPECVNDHGHAYYNGKVYVIGGWACGVASSAVYAYDVASNTWSAPLAPLPQMELSMATAAINGKIYVANGISCPGGFNCEIINNLFIYDIAGNSWTSGPPSPLASEYPAGTAIGGKLYMIGGAGPNTYLYDPVANSWSSGPSLLIPRYFADAATALLPAVQTAVVVGGHNQGFSLNSVEASTLQDCGTPTPTPKATPTPRSQPTPRSRPTPAPRP